VVGVVDYVFLSSIRLRRLLMPPPTLRENIVMIRIKVGIIIIFRTT
jgi:hypothetical protein